MKNNLLMFGIVCLVSLGGILYGYDIGVISGALLFIQDAIPMTDTQIGTIVGAVLAGGLVGTLLAGPIGDRYGRRSLIMMACVIFIIGVFCVLIAHSFIMIFCARLLLGVGVGVIVVAIPLYVAEMVGAKDRGKYMTIFQLLLTVGIVMAYVVDLIFTPSHNWRAMFAVVLMPALILLIGMCWLPETPRWLIANKQMDRARRILKRLNKTSLPVEEEIKRIQASLRDADGAWRELFAPTFFLPTCTAIAVAIFNQLTGINSFLQYAPLILKVAGLNSNEVTMVGLVGIGLVNFFCTLIAITLIDTWGRRPLLLVGVSGVVLVEILLGVIQYVGFDAWTTGVLALCGLFAFIAFFAIGPGVVVWLVIAELFPTRVRGKGMALCLFFNSLTSTLLATFFLPITNYLGMSHTYWLFAAFTSCYFVLAYVWLPETKTRSLEDIQLQFERRG